MKKRFTETPSEPYMNTMSQQVYEFHAQVSPSSSRRVRPQLAHFIGSGWEKKCCFVQHNAAAARLCLRA